MERLEQSMSPDERTKYMEAGSGQVFYLTHDSQTGNWTVEAFAGGPNPLQRVGSWKSREEAVEWLRRHDCSRFEDQD